ncbi:MAG: hypothetical protein ACJAVK_000547 [Akkermansiaceae bacterium]|jgi:hypothetical protein
MGLVKKGDDLFIGEESRVFGGSGEEFVGKGVLEGVPVFRRLVLISHGGIWGGRIQREGNENGEGGEGSSGSAKERLGREKRLPPGSRGFTFKAYPAKGVLRKTRGGIGWGGFLEEIPDGIIFEIIVEIGEVLVGVVGLHGLFRSGEETRRVAGSCAKDEWEMNLP